MTLRYTLIYTWLFSITATTGHTFRWLSLPPVSVHQWRQADGASLAWHYAQHPAFSAAQISNLFYTGDPHALGEFPLLYWLAGIISHYLGYPEYPLRWIGLLLLFAGGWAFGWIILQRAGRPVTAALAAGLLLTSPILGYYGPSFLPDAPAFCFVLMMLAALFQACRRQSPVWLMAAAACAALAVLLKLSMAILPVALAMAWLGGMGWRLFRCGCDTPPPSPPPKGRGACFRSTFGVPNRDRWVKCGQAPLPFGGEVGGIAINLREEGRPSVSTPPPSPIAINLREEGSHGVSTPPPSPPPEGRGACFRSSLGIPNRDGWVKCGRAPLPFGGGDGGGVDTHGDLYKAEFPCYWPLLAIVLTTATVLAGRWWIAEYNTLHQASYFLAATRPIWNYDWPFIREVLAGLLTFGLPAFMSAGLYLACGGSLVLTVKYWKRTPVFLRRTLVLTALGSLAYALLWFRMLREHDYYLICLLAAPVLLLANGIRLAATRFAAKQLVAVLGICWLLGAGHHHYLLSKRLHLAFHPPSSQNLPPDAFLPVQDLTSKQIPPETRVFCPQDPSPNIALFALKRQGWTAYNFGDRISADTLYKYQTRFGLTHLALRDTAVYTPLYRQFFPKPAGATQGWYFYRR